MNHLPDYIRHDRWRCKCHECRRYRRLILTRRDRHRADTGFGLIVVLAIITVLAVAQWVLHV